MGESENVHRHSSLPHANTGISNQAYLVNACMNAGFIAFKPIYEAEGLLVKDLCAGEGACCIIKRSCDERN